MNPTRAAVVLLCVSSIAACDFLKKKGDDAGAAASADDAAAATATDAAATPAATTGTGASNENDVARFPDETALASAAATTKRFANLRVSPGTGAVVQGLGAGTNVTELAQRQNFFLVTVDSGGTKKLGWVGSEAFLPPVDAGLHPPTCKAPEQALMGDVPFCGKKCGSDADCPSGQACKGTAQAFQGNILAPGTVAVCTVTKATAGTVPTTPVAPTAVAVQGDIVPPPCPVGFTQLRDRQCHRRCVPGVRVGACTGACSKCENANVCTASAACP